MTTHNTTPDDSIIESAAAVARRYIDELEHARETQPARLAGVRAEAEVARGWALLEEPYESLVMALPAVDLETGARTGNAIAMPSIAAKELFGARLLFDVLDCGDDPDKLDEVRSRYFKMVDGDTGQMMLLAMSALSTAATLVVPHLLEQIEQRGSDYDARVNLTEARTKAWNDRVEGVAAAGGDAGARE